MSLGLIVQRLTRIIIVTKVTRNVTHVQKTVSQEQILRPSKPQNAIRQYHIPQRTVQEPKYVIIRVKMMMAVQNMQQVVVTGI